MNGIEKITARIDAQTQEEIDRLLADAKEQAAQITAQYRTQAETERASLTARSEKAAQEREKRLVSVAQMEARKVTLSARQEMVERAYELALKTLCTLPQERYTAVLTDLLVKAAPDGKGSVIFAPGDRERVGAASVKAANSRLKDGGLTLAEETRPIQGGFILVNGRVEINCTFDTLVRLQRSETAGAVAKQLFPEG
nr:V-type ATP synthase subunit E [uncultured Dysosmobacter sp.]